MEHKYAGTYRDIARIDKLNELTNTDTFWEDIEKITKNLTSVTAINSWVMLAEIRYKELVGEENIDNATPYSTIQISDNKEELNQSFSEEEIKRFATECAKINTEMWNLVSECRQLLSMPIAKALIKKPLDKEIMSELYMHYESVAEDKHVIRAEQHSSTLINATDLAFIIVKNNK